MKRLLIILSSWLLSSISLNAQVGNKSIVKDCIVQLQRKIGSEYQTFGTGFLIADKCHSNRTLVVTCKHLLGEKELYIVLPLDTTKTRKNKRLAHHQGIDSDNHWAKDGLVFRRRVVLEDHNLVKHGRADIGAIVVKEKISSRIPLYWDSTSVYYTNLNCITSSEIGTLKSITLGRQIVFSGFPFCIGTKEGFLLRYNGKAAFSGSFKGSCCDPVLRSGTIAWLSSLSNEFLIDAFVYSGNSGSPVFAKNSLFGNHLKLIGIVSGHLPDTLIIHKVDNKEVKSQEGNSGLGRCYYIYDIMEVIEMAETLE